MLLPHEATERQFMEALAETSLHMQRCHCVRAARFRAFEYRGPQCLPHRDDAELLAFEPKEELERTHRGVAPEEPLPLLQCSKPCCLKWRRVDASTRDVFDNGRWWYDRLVDEERALHCNCPHIDTWLRRWVKERVSERSREPFVLSSRLNCVSSNENIASKS